MIELPRYADALEQAYYLAGREVAPDETLFDEEGCY